MGAGVDLSTHRTSGVRHEVLGTAGNGAHDIRGSDVAAHACIRHDRASKVGILAACRRGTAKRSALTASEAETGRYLREPAPSRPCRRSKESSHRLEGHGASSCSNDLHGHREGARCKEQALESGVLDAKMLAPHVSSAKQEVAASIRMHNATEAPAVAAAEMFPVLNPGAKMPSLAGGYGPARRAVYSDALLPNVTGRRGP